MADTVFDLTKHVLQQRIVAVRDGRVDGDGFYGTLVLENGVELYVGRDGDINADLRNVVETPTTRGE